MKTTTITTNNTKAQRDFILARLKEREHSTNELRQMGVYYPPARIKELRKQGYKIDTLFRQETDQAGIVHHVGVYMLRQGEQQSETAKRHPNLD